MNINPVVFIFCVFLKKIKTKTKTLFTAHTDTSRSIALVRSSSQISIRQTPSRSLSSPLTFVLLSGIQMDSHFPTILLGKPFDGKCLPYLITAYCTPCGYPVRFLLYPPVILRTSGWEKKNEHVDYCNIVFSLIMGVKFTVMAMFMFDHVSK